MQGDLKDDGLKWLSEALTHNKTLANLDLSYNDITDEGCQWLCRALESNQALTYLNLHETSVTENAVHLLYKCVQRNPSLRRLALDADLCFAEDRVALLNHLVDNYRLYKRNITDTIANMLCIARNPQCFPREIWVHIFSLVELPGIAARGLEKIASTVFSSTEQINELLRRSKFKLRVKETRYFGELSIELI